MWQGACKGTTCGSVGTSAICSVGSTERALRLPSPPTAFQAIPAPHGSPEQSASRHRCWTRCRGWNPLNHVQFSTLLQHTLPPRHSRSGQPHRGGGLAGRVRLITGQARASTRQPREHSSGGRVQRDSNPFRQALPCFRHVPIGFRPNLGVSIRTCRLGSRSMWRSWVRGLSA